MENVNPVSVAITTMNTGTHSQKLMIKSRAYNKPLIIAKT